MDDFDRGAMLETFLHEMGTLIDQLENSMITAGEFYTMDTINEIFRVMHTVKGSASMMLFTAMAETTHVIEDLFFFLREQNPDDADYPLITDLVLEVVDFIKLQLSHLVDEEELDETPTDLVARIKNCLSALKGEVGAVAKSDAAVAVASAIEAEGGSRYSALIFFQEGSEMENVRAFTIIHNLTDIATNVITVPANVLDEESIWQIRKEGFRLEFDSDQGLDQIRNILMQSIYIKDLQLEKISGISSASEGRTYDIMLRFKEDSGMENVRAFAFVNNLPDTVTILKQTPGDLLDEYSAEVIQKNGFHATVVTNITQYKLEDIVTSAIYLEDYKVTLRQEAGQAAEEQVQQPVAATAEVEQKALVSEEIVSNHQEVSVPKDQSVSNTQTKVAEDTTKAEDNTKPVAKQDSDKPKPTGGDNTPKKAVQNQNISVNITKLDQLLNLVGELVISEAMVTQNPELAGLELENFTKESRQLRKIIGEVQYTVMSMRMVPLSPTFFKMHRIVRDMCRSLGKDVVLEVIGDDTEVDKNIIEQISDPLMHIIRNSVDHGIEMPEVRLENGKPEQGTVTLEAKNSGGDVLIIIRDDGAGFNRTKILEKAERNGMLFKPIEEYTDKEVYQFIFSPGFSTNEAVTTYSGRGVGMDVVNTNLEQVGGSVIADSVDGEGSSITLKIPLTLAIIDGMLIKIGDAKYVIPIMDIRRSLKVTKDDIVFDPSGNEMVKIRGEVYNLVRLNRFFGLNEGHDKIEDGIVLMLENADSTVCVFADELVGEQQIVVKNIPKYIKKVNGLTGCTLLGNGDISLIINVAAFFDR